MASSLRTSAPSLEAVAQEDLHEARRSLNGLVAAPVDRWRLGLWIERDTKAAPSSIKGPHRLVVEEVEDLPPELQVVTFVVGHLETLSKSKVGVDSADISENVPVTSLTRQWITKALEGLRRVAAEERSTPCRAGGYRTDPHRTRLDVPVGCPARIIVG